MNALLELRYQQRHDECELLKIGDGEQLCLALQSCDAALREYYLDAYDERIAIICEGREPSADDVRLAWGSTLHNRFPALWDWRRKK